MMTPSLRSQYERAILEAMKQAGVGADDPVMLVGFSQGGIVAGHVAAYNQTLQSNIDQVPATDRADLDRYFIGDPHAYGYEQSYYSWQEN